MIGLFLGSVLIMVDVINSLFDIIFLVLILVGFYIVGKLVDKEYFYGYECFEYISGMFVLLVIMFIGFEFLMIFVDCILYLELIKVIFILFVVLVLLIGIKIW